MNIDFQKTIKELEKYPLSDNDINSILDNPTKIHNLLDIQDNIFRIDEIFDRLGRCIVLIPTENKNTGHWVAFIIDEKNTTIEYFDSYGYPFTSIHSKLGAMQECNPRWFINTVKNSGYRFLENKRIYQSRSDEDNSTCGRWCALRITLHKLNNNEFSKWISGVKKKYKVKKI